MTSNRRELIGLIERNLNETTRSLDLLRASMQNFGSQFDADLFIEAFESFDAERANTVRAAERNFENVMNSIVEMVRAALTLAQLAPAGRRPHAAQDFSTLAEAGVIDTSLSDALAKLHDLRNRLQHHYTDVKGAELHRRIAQLDQLGGDFLGKFARWLKTIISSSQAGPAIHD